MIQKTTNDCTLWNKKNPVKQKRFAWAPQLTFDNKQPTSQTFSFLMWLTWIKQNDYETVACYWMRESHIPIVPCRLSIPCSVKPLERQSHRKRSKSVWWTWSIASRIQSSSTPPEVSLRSTNSSSPHKSPSRSVLISVFFCFPHCASVVLCKEKYFLSDSQYCS